MIVFQTLILTLHVCLLLYINHILMCSVVFKKKKKNLNGLECSSVQSNAIILCLIHIFDYDILVVNAVAYCNILWKSQAS